MNAKARRGKRRRSLEKESPTEKGVEEEIVEVLEVTSSPEKMEEVKEVAPPPEKTKEVKEVVSSPGGKGDWEATARWDDIGEKEEMFLANEREELYELIMRWNTFKHKVKKKGNEELWDLAISLVEYGRRNVEELQMLQPEEDVRDCPEERSELGKFTALVSFQQKRLGWMMREFWNRLHGASEALASRIAEVETLKEENGTLRRSLEVIVRERGELLDGLGSRRSAQKDASTSTEAEVPEVEMVADPALPLSGEIPRGDRGVLEAIVEEKMAEVLARIGFPLVGRSMGQGDSGRRVVQPPRVIDTWSEVVKRRSKRRPPISGDNVPQGEKEPRAVRRVSPPVVNTTGGKREPLRAGRGGRKKTKRRVGPAPPSTAAVVLSAPVGQEAACVELLKRAKKSVSIEEMGIPSLRVRRTRMGGLILGVPGEHPQAGADCLAASLSGLASGLGVRVSRPSRRADVMVSGLEESITEDEVVTAVANLAGCSSEGIRSGRIRWSPAGVGALWLQCPIETATKAAKEGSVKVGWVQASVEMLRARPLRCYKCLEVGHVVKQCTSEVDRARRCYRCGSEGHTALHCKEGVSRCPLCADKGRPYQHVLGGKGCCNDIPPPTRSRAGGVREAIAQDARAASSSAG